ncbi:hypothetical protein OG21DRAFT_298820 [Imleria badia]|nr:hypothetical protein OG21DRAFT_298820 [Imleria badia]
MFPFLWRRSTTCMMLLSVIGCHQHLPSQVILYSIVAVCRVEIPFFGRADLRHSMETPIESQG